MAVHPCGWLVLAADGVREIYRNDDTRYLGVLHEGHAERASVHRGAELSLGQCARLRWGDNDGQPTLGLSLALGSLWLNYTEAQGPAAADHRRGGGVQGRAHLRLRLDAVSP